MATKRFKTPMVGDAPPEQPERHRIERGEAPSSDYAWAEWADLIISCLFIPKSIQDLVDFWKANDAMIGYVKDIHPEIYERVKDSFTKRKLQLMKDD